VKSVDENIVKTPRNQTEDESKELQSDKRWILLFETMRR
jgi:hypothetical protein